MGLIMPLGFSLAPYIANPNLPIGPEPDASALVQRGAEQLAQQRQQRRELEARTAAQQQNAGLEQQRIAQSGLRSRLEMSMRQNELDLRRGQLQQQEAARKAKEEADFLNDVQTVVKQGSASDLAAIRTEAERRGYRLDGAEQPTQGASGAAPSAPTTNEQQEAFFSNLGRAQQLDPGARLMPGVGSVTPKPVGSAPAPGPEQPSAPKRLRLWKGDKIIYDADLDAVRNENSAALDGVFAPYIQQGSPTQQAAAMKALDSAKKRLGSAPLNTIIDDAQKQYQFEVHEAESTRRAGMRPGGGGLSAGQQQTQAAGAWDDVTALARDVAARNGLGPMWGRKKLDAERTLRSLDDPNAAGPEQRIVLGQAIKATFGAPSDAERNFITGSAGLIEKLQQQADYLIGGGELSPRVLAGLKSTIRALLDQGREAEARAFEEADIGVDQHFTLTPDQRERARRYLRGVFHAGQRGGTGAPPAAKPSGGGKPSAPRGGKTQRKPMSDQDKADLEAARSLL